MKVIVNDSTNIIEVMSEIAELRDNGIFVGAYIISGAGLSIYDVETIPSGVVQAKYCYTVVDGFYVNPAWQEPEATTDEKVERLLIHLVVAGVITEAKYAEITAKTYSNRME